MYPGRRPARHCGLRAPHEFNTHQNPNVVTAGLPSRNSTLILVGKVDYSVQERQHANRCSWSGQIYPPPLLSTRELQRSPRNCACDAAGTQDA
ncbi:unnamed protein product [Pieris brassicae]|uniref:Uncharacterized protein n=1 Tax=Pieris brassicae TaxID=7116 RepID=A0A9P0SUT6_PIEBR|nr:unnamed protein product [Pieris brassicae]